MKLFFSAICFVLLASCNNSADDKETKKDSMTINHSTMDHSPNTTGDVPTVPAIPQGAKVVFGNLKNNATISSPFTLQMGVEEMDLDSAGLVRQASGHHHLIIDGPDSLASGTIVPKDSVNIHFGNAQTEYELKLTPGKHKLTLQFADGLHRSYGSKLAASVMVNVK
ncbi:MAG: DUF4399 domain-containing protein [Chitinophagaceae bacterium]